MKRLTVCKFLVSALLLAPAAATAGNIWDGGCLANDNWGSATNWDSDTAPSLPGLLTFGGTTRLTPYNDLVAQTVNGFTFASGAGAFTIGGNAITLGGDINSSAAANTQTINLDMTLGARPTVKTVTAAPVVLGGVISGPFGLTTDGSDYVQFKGVNTYTGETVITNTGYTSICSASAFGSGLVKFGGYPGDAQDWVVASGTDRTVTNNVEIQTARFITHSVTVAGQAAGKLTLSGSVLLNQSLYSSSDFYCINDLTLSGPVSGGPKGLNLVNGKLTLQGSNTFSNNVSFFSGGFMALTLNINSDAALGDAANGVNFNDNATLQAGATPISLAATRTFNIAAAKTATFDVPDTFTMTVAGAVQGNASADSMIAKTGSGTLILTGGSGGSTLGGMSSGAGKISVQGGTWTVGPQGGTDSQVFNIAGEATYEQTGGTMNAPYYAIISQTAASSLTSTGIFSGGTFNSGALLVGRRNNAVLTVSGSALLSLDGLLLGWDAGYTTTCNLDGGVINCYYVSSPGALSILNFNGGTLRSKWNAANFILPITAANVKRGGAIIDSQGWEVTIGQALLHDSGLGATPDGGLTKLGTGSLSLTANNTYNGVTSVQGGTLKLGVANTLLTSGSVQVASNAVFDVAGEVQTLAGLGGSGLVTNNNLLAVTGEVAPGGTNVIGMLTLAAAPAELGGAFKVDVATDGACDRLHVQGNLNITNLALAVANTGALNRSQRYTVATYTGTLTGPFAAAPLPARWGVRYDTITRQVILRYNYDSLIMLR